MFKNFKSKKLTSFVVAVTMIFSLIAPSSVFAAEATNGSVTLQILATSDTHGKFMAYDYATNSKDDSGSLAQIASAVKKLRSDNPNNTILVDAGDTIEGNSSDIFFNEEIHPMIAAFNEMGYDAVVPGNHEFNFGVPTLEKVLKGLKAPVLMGNVFRKDGTTLGKAYEIVTTKDGVKVGIIGMTNPNITRWDSENLKDYKVTNPIEETQKVIKEIKDKVDVLIAVEHLAEQGEYGTAGSGAEEIAKACPELTAIVGAHGHMATPSKKINNVLFIENSNLGQTLGQINIKLTKKDGKYVVADKEKDLTSILVYMKDTKTKEVVYKEDAELVKKLQPYHEKALKDAEAVIGELKGGDLVPADEIKGIPTAQIQDTAMIDLINAVQMHYSGADVAAAAAFSTTANIKEGKVKKSDTSLIYKYPNTLYLLQVTGKQLKQYMEWSANFYNTVKPGDLTLSFNENIRGYNYDMFSGVKYEIDVTKEPGSRVVNLRKMDDTLIKDTDVLKLAVNNYRATSHLLSEKNNEIYKDGNLPKLLEKDMVGGKSVRELIGDYIKNVKAGAITAQLDNNWKLVGTNWDLHKRAVVTELVNSGKMQLPKSADGRTDNVKAITSDAIKGYDLITIAHTNDTHSRVKESSNDGMGFAKVSTEIDRLRATTKNVLVLDAGDTLHGQTIASLSKGESIVKIMNSIGYDAMTPGNHDFNYGQDRLLELSKITNFPILAANLLKADGSNVYKPYTIKEINGVKFGIFGLATPETAYKTNPKNVQGLTFQDPVVAAKKMVEELKGKCDIVVALAHLGDNGEDTSIEVAEKVSGINIIVDGHSHTTLPAGKLVNNTLIVQTGDYDKNLGEVNLLFKDGKLDNIRATLFSKAQAKNISEDKEILSIVSEIDKENSKVTSAVIGNTKVELDGVRGNVRTKETNLADLITNAMLDATGADIALTNGGGIRASIDVGDITKGEVITVLPFGNYVVLKEVKGSDIIAALELGISDYPKEKGGFPQVAGITYSFNPNNKAGSRLVEVKVNGKAIDKNKVYKLATNDFMAVGGDGYTMLAGGKTLAEYPSLDEILINYIQKLGAVDIKTDGRVIVTTEEKKVEDKKIEDKPVVKLSNLYTVNKGDTLKKIADRYNVGVQEIVKANGIKNPKLILPGQKLQIPGKIVITNDTVYVVVKGDTLKNIGNKFGIDYSKIVKKNNIKNSKMIYVGQELIIPLN